MNNNISTQPSAGANTMMTPQGPYPCIDLSNKIPEYVNKFLPVTALELFNPVVPIKKIYVNETRLNPFFNILLKQVAARLSDIEMAFDCYDVSNLQFSTHALKDLFITMHMPSACRYTGQMEEMARENKLREAKYLLLGIKKIIAQSLQSHQQLNDS
jgi:hypothetical protein